MSVPYIRGGGGGGLNGEGKSVRGLLLQTDLGSYVYYTQR
jgi:hypothetical protein